jgi:hypothetical protein
VLRCVQGPWKPRKPSMAPDPIWSLGFHSEPSVYGRISSTAPSKPFSFSFQGLLEACWPFVGRLHMTNAIEGMPSFCDLCNPGRLSRPLVYVLAAVDAPWEVICPVKIGMVKTILRECTPWPQKYLFRVEELWRRKGVLKAFAVEIYKNSILDNSPQVLNNWVCISLLVGLHVSHTILTCGASARPNQSQP